MNMKKLNRNVLCTAMWVILLFLWATVARGQSESDTTRIELPATVEGSRSIDLFARASGYIDDIRVDIGDRVKSGQPLVTIHAPELQARVAQREAELMLAQAQSKQAEAAQQAAEAETASRRAAVEEAKMSLAQLLAELEYRALESRRMERLVESGSINQELLDASANQVRAAQARVDAGKAHVQAVEAVAAVGDALLKKAEADRDAAAARVEVARADLMFARAMAGYAEIQAPMNGLITKRWMDPGDLVQSADGNSAARPVLRLVHTDILTIVAQASMSQAPAIKVGDAATFSRVDGLPGLVLTGKVTRIAGGLDEKSRMMRIEVDIESPDPRLMPGHFGYLTIAPSDQ